MATIPTLDIPRVATAPLPGERQGARLDNPRADLAAFGGGIAATPIDFSAPAALAQKLKDQADQIASTKLASDLTAAKNRVIQAQLAKQGNLAFSAPEDAAKDWQKEIAEVTKGAKNDVQKAFLSRAALNDWNDVDLTVQRHVAGERQRYDNDVTEGFVKNTADEIVAHYEDPDAVAMAQAKQVAVLTDFFRRNGHANADGSLDDFAKERIAATLSSGHLSVIQQLLDVGKQDVKAAAYLDAHKDEIVGKDLMQAERLTDAGSVLGQSRREAQRIIATAKSLDEAQSAIDEIADTRVADAVEHRVRQHFADVANQAQAEAAERYQQAGQILDQTHSVDEIPAGIWEKLTAPQISALRNEETRLRMPRVLKDPGDPEKLAQLRNEAYFNPESFAAQDLLKIDGLNAAQMHELQTLQRSVGNRELRADVSSLQKDLTKAQADAHYWLRKIEVANAAGNPDGLDAYNEQLKEANKRTREATQAIEGRKKAGVAGEPQEKPAPVAKLPATKQMLDDVARLGPRYAQYLRDHLYDVPEIAEKAIVAPVKKEPKK